MARYDALDWRQNSPGSIHRFGAYFGSIIFLLVRRTYNTEGNELPEELEVPAANLTLAEKEDILAVLILLAEDFLEGLLDGRCVDDFNGAEADDLADSAHTAFATVFYLMGLRAKESNSQPPDKAHVAQRPFHG